MHFHQTLGFVVFVGCFFVYPDCCQIELQFLSLNLQPAAVQINRKAECDSTDERTNKHVISSNKSLINFINRNLCTRVLNLNFNQFFLDTNTHVQTQISTQLFMCTGRFGKVFDIPLYSYTHMYKKNCKNAFVQQKIKKKTKII